MLPEHATKPRWTARLKQWIHAHPARAYTLIGLGLVLAAGLTAFAILWQQPGPVAKQAPSVPPKPAPVYYSPLTGEKVKSATAQTKPVTAIMIENSPDARPQSGLKAAEVVYEAVAEGGITRFLAVYQQSKPKLIGPVRSLRMYYVDWLTPYNASVAHVGGSAKALKVVRSNGYRDIDQFFSPNAYYRATDRYAPHNVYTTSKRLDTLNKQKKYHSSQPKDFDRADDEKRPQNAKRVTVNISSPTYNSQYRYNAKTKLYTRYQAGAVHKDRESGAIRAKVIVALNVNMRAVMEDGYREEIVTSGKGKATIFQNGNAQTVTWHKKGRSGQLYFTDKDGDRVSLARGTTWIAAVPNDGGSVKWK